jgi:hypothetical protein
MQNFNQPHSLPGVTIVSGLPRSGTSLMMAMLEAGGMSPLVDNLRAADEDNLKGYYEFERVKKLRNGDFAWLSNAQGKVVKVISALIPFLPAMYEYRIIFMQRSPAEILASQRQMLIRRGENPDTISDENMARLFEKHLQQVKEWMAKQPNIQSIDVSYNQLLEQPDPLILVVNQFLNHRLDPDKMAAVIDPQLYRQRR